MLDDVSDRLLALVGQDLQKEAGEVRVPPGCGLSRIKGINDQSLGVRIVGECPVRWWK